MKPSEFAEFVGGWFIRQDGFHDELLEAREHAGEDGYTNPEDLVNRVIRHYTDYFEHKALVRENDCFALFGPTWFSDLEKCFLWVAGFKPMLALAILDQAVNDTTEEQRERIINIERETMEAETKIEKRLAEVQERIGDPEPATAIRKWGREEGITAEEEEETVTEVEKIKEAMKEVVEAADTLRMKTMINVMGVLKSIQKVKLLASMAILHKKLRLYASQRPSQAATPMQR